MRYSRQIILPEFGAEGQQKLKNSSVMIIGAGGLGVPVLQYLTAAGVGRIGIIDQDNVELSNLHRQVIYTEREVDLPKAQLAKEKMIALNSEIQIDAFERKLTSENAIDLLKNYNLIVDCTDNFPTRYLVNDACVLLDKPLIYGAIFRFEGQVSVFNYNNGPNYRDLYPDPPKPGEVPNCEEGGVLGVLPGVIGSLQAIEAVKIIASIGETLSGKLLLFDAKSSTTQILKYKARADNPISGKQPTITQLIDYEEFCGVKINIANSEQITARKLKDWLENGKDFQLIDIREADEYAIHNINGENIPLSKIKTETHRIEDEIPVVLMCQTGKRSLSVLQFLKMEHDFDNLLNLKGGLKAYLGGEF